MRKLSIDETWDYTKRMWKWVAFQVEVLKDERGVHKLKRIWIEENASEFVDMLASCFFCENQKNCGGCNENCPGKLVELDFNCCNTAHNYSSRPGAFYREILRLDAIRTAVTPEPVVVEHKWVHGDVFSNHVFSAQMYVELFDGPMIINLEQIGHGGTPGYQLRPNAEPEFLFNIADALSDRGIL